MDLALRRPERGHPMSRYIATTILAIAAALVTVAELAVTVDQPDGVHAAFLVRP